MLLNKIAQMHEERLDSAGSGKFRDARVEQVETGPQSHPTSFSGECLDRMAWQGKPLPARDLPETAPRGHHPKEE